MKGTNSRVERMKNTILEKQLTIHTQSKNAALFGGYLMVIFTILAGVVIYGAMIGFIVWVIVTVLKMMGVL